MNLLLTAVTIGGTDGFCAGTANIWQIVGYVLFAFKIAIPVLLIIFGMIDLGKAVIASKDETISAFKNENSFLKEALMSMQEVYDDDKKTMEVLRDELANAREEVEFIKKKYRLMWGRVSNMSGK